MKSILLAGFVVMVIAQWAVPFTMMRSAHEVLDMGVEYKFKTRPVDPSDPFRGKYVTLDYEAETYVPSDTNEIHAFNYGDKVFAMLVPDSAGFMKVNRLVKDQPQQGLEYLIVKMGYAGPAYVYDDSTSVVKVTPTINLEFPFDRFYVEESKASETEQLYWNTRSATDSDSVSVCYAKVKIYNGKATLVDVMINDRPILDIVRELNAAKEDSIR
jgi:uncharacterized membrane-anchored protein